MKSRLGWRARHAFTLVELLTVIAIIAVLAALLFPVFGAVREQTRQSNTMSNMHAMYVGASLFYQDEKQYPPTLFPYAETAVTPAPSGGCPVTQPAHPTQIDSNGDTTIPLDQAKGLFTETADCTQLNRGYLYGEQVKDYISFTCPDNLTTDKYAVTEVYYPLSVYSTPQLVTWQQANPNDPASVGDPDLPYDPNISYVNQPKLYYLMDAMDIGPMLDSAGQQQIINGKPAYELHYTPDWTHELGATADVNASGQPNVTQLKYQNPPPDRTVITYVTYHVVNAHSSSVLVLLDSGTTLKLNYQTALQLLPMSFHQ